MFRRILRRSSAFRSLRLRSPVQPPMNPVLRLNPTARIVATHEWLGENSGYEVLEATLLKDAVEVRIAGTGDLPSVDDLSAKVNETANREVELVVKVMEQKTLVPGSSAEAGG